jgi:dUTP pyrophosphatase
MDRVVIKVKRLAGYAEDIELPKKQSAQAAGFDVRAANQEPIELKPGQRAAVPTGLALAIPPGCEVQVRPRSGLALKHGIILPNSPGTIDSDYRGELKVIMMNLGERPFMVKAGDRIAQLVVGKICDADWVEVEDLEETERSGGGFGSTGI